ncbi:MAG TPA: hypothetical protein DEP84_18090 [Chloroflexi bacterium]|nr:hypothetical protein [Chloroflexota bacterium]
MTEYRSGNTGLAEMGGVAVFAMAVVIALIPLLGMIWQGAFVPGAFCFSVGILIFGGALGLLFLNMYPTIWVNDKGIFISYNLSRRAFIPWDDIVTIKKAFPPWMGTLVVAQHITPLHRIYGWQWGKTFYPSFLISPSTQNYDELLRELNRRRG